MTKIEWTDETWNPTRGCSRVSEGCRYCYAERQAARNLPSSRSPTTGAPFAILNGDGPHWTGKVELIESKLTEPLHWKKPRRVFVNSMSDLFHEALPDEAIDCVFAVMAICPQHTFQVLTKRPDNMQKWASQHVTPDCIDALIAGLQIENRPEFQWPLPNVWLGVSVEDQDTADDRIPKLLQTPAALRFVSYEPALGPVDFGDYLGHLLGCDGECYPCEICGSKGKIGWGIVGGESGPQARPCDLAWIESSVDQFKAAVVPLFVKQIGSRPGYQRMDGWHDIDLKDSKGGNWDEWPEKLRVREFPR